MKCKFILLVTLLVITLSGCNEATPIEGEVFKEKWTTSNMQSAISWWYLGENEEQYFIAEKWPTKKNIYSISKHSITINDVEAFRFNSGIEPVNLKNNNVVFKQNAL